MRHEELRLFHVAVSRATRGAASSPRLRRRRAAERPGRPGRAAGNRCGAWRVSLGRRRTSGTLTPARPRRCPCRPWWPGCASRHGERTSPDAADAAAAGLARLAARRRARRRTRTTGTAWPPLSDDRPLVPTGAPVRVSPSKVESFDQCGLRWLLETSGRPDPAAAARRTSATWSTTSPPTCPTPTEADAARRAGPRAGRGWACGPAGSPTSAPAGRGHGGRARGVLPTQRRAEGRDAGRRRAAGRRPVGRAVVGRPGRPAGAHCRRLAAASSTSRPASTPRACADGRGRQPAARGLPAGRPGGGLRRTSEPSRRPAPSWSCSAPRTKLHRSSDQPPLPPGGEPGGRAGPELLDEVADGMAGADVRGPAGPHCRNCPVRTSCPVQPEGRAGDRDDAATRRPWARRTAMIAAAGSGTIARARSPLAIGRPDPRRSRSRSSRRRPRRCWWSPARARARPRRWPRGWSGWSPTGTPRRTRCSG